MKWKIDPEKTKEFHRLYEEGTSKQLYDFVAAMRPHKVKIAGSVTGSETEFYREICGKWSVVSSKWDDEGIVLTQIKTFTILPGSGHKGENSDWQGYLEDSVWIRFD